MPTHSETLQSAVEQHRAGNLRQAEQLYLQVVAAEPNHAGARHLLGLAYLSQGDAARAIEHLERTVAEDSGSAVFRHHLALALAAAGRQQESLAQFREALAIDAGGASLHNDLAGLLRGMGRTAEAEASYREAIRLDPQMAEAHNNLGNLLQGAQQWPAALEAFQTSVRLRPEVAELRFNLGNCYKAQAMWDDAVAAYREAIALKPVLAAAHHQLGTVLQSRGRHLEAAASQREALRLDPQLVAAHTALGTALQSLGHLAEAKAAYLDTIAQAPDDATACYNLGTVLMAEGRLKDAAEPFRAVTELSPAYADAHFYLGQCLHLTGELDLAIAAFERAIALVPDEPRYRFWQAQTYLLQSNHAASLNRLDEVLRLRPDHAEAHVCRGMILTAQGNLIEGGRENEHRLRMPESAGRPFPQPRWDGSPLAGRTILIDTEGGLGDTLQFIRYVPLVRARGGAPIVEVQRPLLGLLQESGFEGVIGRGDPLPPFDVQVRSMGLPLVFGTTLDSIPADVPYLAARPALVEVWRERLSAVPGFKVGIHWQGSPSFDMDPYRSIPLAQFAPLAAVPGVSLVSLQKGHGEDQIAAVAGEFRVIAFDDVDADHGAFMDTAAIIKNLDLVITSDSAVAHLAGGLGAPVWLALAACAECRWLLERDDSPWYPTMQLFRQTVLGEWPSVFARIAAELASLVKARGL